MLFFFVMGSGRPEFRRAVFTSCPYLFDALRVQYGFRNLEFTTFLDLLPIIYWELCVCVHGRDLKFHYSSIGNANYIIEIFGLSFISVILSGLCLLDSVPNRSQT